MLTCVFLDGSLKKLSYVQPTPLKFPKSKNSCKWKKSNLEPKYLTCVFLKCNFEKVLSYGKSVLLNWSKDKFFCKNKNPQIQMINFQILVWVFCDSSLKNYCNIWTHHHRINQFANIRAKILKTWIWKQKCPIWVLLGDKFKKTSVTFEIIIPK